MGDILVGAREYFTLEGAAGEGGCDVAVCVVFSVPPPKGGSVACDWVCRVVFPAGFNFSLSFGSLTPEQVKEFAHVTAVG